MSAERKDAAPRPEALPGEAGLNVEAKCLAAVDRTLAEMDEADVFGLSVVYRVSPEFVHGVRLMRRERDEARRALEEIRDFQPVTAALDAELDEARKASQECAECKRLRAIPYGVLTACSEHYDLRARIETRIYHEEAYQAKWRLKEIARAALAARPAETPEGR